MKETNKKEILGKNECSTIGHCHNGNCKEKKEGVILSETELNPETKKEGEEIRKEIEKEEGLGDNLSWEEKFDERFDEAHSAGRLSCRIGSDKYLTTNLGKIKSFVKKEMGIALSQRETETIERIKGMRKKEYEYEHIYPIDLGIMTPDGFKKTISKGQKETMTQQLDEDEILYNEAIDDIITNLSNNHE